MYYHYLINLTKIFYKEKWHTVTHTICNTSVIKDFLIYSSGAFFLRIINVCLMPIILHTVSPEEYGTLSLVNSFIAILAPMVGCGLRQVFTLEYFHQVGISRQRLVNEVIGVYVLVCSPICVLLYYMRIPLQHFFWGQVVNEILLSCAFMQIYTYFFVELLNQVLSYERNARLLTSLQVSIALITIVFSLIFLLQLQYGIGGIIGAQCIGSFVACCFGLYWYYTNYYYKFFSVVASVKKIFYYTSYGIPFLPGMIFAWLLASGNRWFLLRYGTLHDVGIYAIADMCGQLFYTMILLPWSGSYLPYILTSYAQNTQKLLAIEHRNQVLMYSAMFFFSLCIIGGYLFCTPLLHWVLPIAYRPAIAYIWPLLMGYVFLLGSYFASSFIQFHKKSYFLAFAFAIPAILNGLLNSLLIPHCGLYGCTTATCISYLVYFGIVLGYNYYLQRIIR